MKKRICLVLAVLFCFPLFIFTGCGSSDSVNITVWAAQMDFEMVRNMTTEWMAHHNNGRVNRISVQIVEDHDAIGEWSANPDLAGDIISFPSDQLGEFIAINGLFPIIEDNFVAQINQNMDEAVAATKGTITAQGETRIFNFGFPYTFDTHVLYYDTRLLSAGQAASFESIFNIGMATPIGISMTDAFYTANFFMTYGARLFGHYGTDPNFLDFNSDASVEAMEWVSDNRSSIQNVARGAATGIIGRDIASYISGPYAYFSFRQALGQNLGIAALPAIGDRPMVSFANFKMYGVSQRTAHRDLAMEIAAFLANEQNQRTRFQFRRYIPTNSALQADETVLADPLFGAVMEQTDNIVGVPSIPAVSGFWIPVGRTVGFVHSGTIARGDIRSRLNEMVAEILSA